ncbi:M13 family metallopeptidase N-terminal domain-containing protein [uncultured Phenylobacterium sp.]|uniref:M13 family metallopeptidase N-terminal domain-containing protein n=1 Tax=uncultured Phenylobacterium sp. TaxID=349273 RepID=UPI0025D7B57B|nr:M13 family metallopeptidase N-terminal domain-containing protein [uncultured Phenylobacterium sp.]
MTVRLLAAASAILLLSACATVPEAPPPARIAAAPPPAPPAMPKPEVGTFGFNVAGMDRSVAPGDDFYRYAVGKWVDETEIPPDRSSVGSFVVIAEKTAARIRGIIEASAETPNAEGSDARKIGDYFASFMDEARIEALGAEPLKPELEQIAAIRTRKDLSAALGGQLRADVDVLNATNYYTPRIWACGWPRT